MADNHLQLWLLDSVARVTGLGLNWLVQSSILLVVGLFVGWLLRRGGPAAQSVVYRTTLVAVIVCPVATWSLALTGVSGWPLDLPATWMPVDVREASSIGSETQGTIDRVAAAEDFEFILAAQPLVAEPTDALAENASPATASAPLPGDSAITKEMPITTTNGPTVRPELGQGLSAAGQLREAPTFVIRRFGVIASLLCLTWMVTAGALLARIAAAWRRLSRLRNSATEAGPATVTTCRAVASLMRVAVPDVKHSPYLGSPCLAGFRRPAVLLPEGSMEMTIRDVLIHELAHLRRRDCHWNLLRRLATAIFFFQPLLWKLSLRLEATAEWVCDDYVLQYGSDRQAYAHRLVDIAELSSAPVAAAGVGIVSLRSLLAKRVVRIMDTSRSLSTRVGSLLTTLVFIGGFVGTTVVGLVGVGPQPLAAETDSALSHVDDGSADEDRAADNHGEETVEAAQEEDLITVKREYEGKVVDPTGKPVEGAELYLVFHIPQPTGLLSPTWKPAATTDAAGAFRFAASPKDFGIHSTAREFGHGALVAVKDGFGFAWSQAGMYETSGKLLRDARARLKDAPLEFLEQMKRMLSGAGEPLKLVVDNQPIRGRILDINGQPVAGARLTLLEVRSGLGDDLNEWRQVAKEPKADYYSARMKTPMAINGPQVRSLVQPAKTDANGDFTLHGVGRGRIAELLIEGPGIESAKIFARTEAGEKIELLRERRSPDLGSYIYFPAELIYVAGPSAAITGVVRDAQTEAPLAGVTVKSQSRHGEPISGWGQDFVRAVTEEDGRYRLEGLPVGSDNRIAAIAPSGDIPYFSMSKRAATDSQEPPLNVDFELRRGVWIEGRITDRQTGKGLSGRLAYSVKKGNPSYRFARSLYVDQRDRLLSDDNGCFRIVAMPGPGFLTFMAHQHENYPRADAIVKLDGSREKVGRTMLETGPSMLMPQNYHLVAAIDPAADAGRVELNLQLDSGNRVVGRVVDGDDGPVTGFYFSGQMAQFATWTPSAGDKFEVRGYDPESPRHVYFAHRELNLAGHVIVKGEAPEDVVVRLQEAGQVKGRLVDQDGAPLANCQLVPWHPPMRSPTDFVRVPHTPPLPPNMAHWQSGQYETDEKGRFEISCLAPDVEYRLRAYDRASMTPTRGRVPKVSGPLAVIIQVAPGESKDLGDVRLADEAEFKDAAKQGAKASADQPPQHRTVVTGRITLPGGEPAADAHVAVIAMRIRSDRGGDLSPPGAVLAEVTATKDGTYRLSIEGASSKTHRYANLIARKEGTAVAWRQLNLDAETVEASLELPPEEPIAVRLVDIEGQPAGNVRLLAQSVMKRSDDGKPSRDGVGYRGSEEIPAAWLHPVTTDEQGRFTLRGVTARHGVLLNIAGNDRFAPQSIALNTGMPEQRGERDGTYRSLVKNVAPGEEAVLPLAPAQVFEGVVTYEDTGEPASHARLTIWASQQEYGSMVSVPGKADAEGRYRICPKPGIRFGVTAYPPDGVAYLARRTPLSEAIRWEAGNRAQHVDMTLPRGVLIRGRVVESGTDAPVAGASIQYVPEEDNNPNTTDDILTGWQGIQLSNERGDFEIVVLPGPGHLLVHGPQGKYVLKEIAGRQLRAGKPGGRRNYVHAWHKVDPEKGAEPISVTLRPQPGITVAGRIVDEQGKSVDEVLIISRVTYSPLSLHWRGQMPPTLGGQFELPGLEEGQDYPVHFLDAKRRHGATAMVHVGGDEPIVVLKPCGTVTARYIDPEGSPHVGFRPGLNMIVTPGVHQHDWDAAKRGELAADADFVSNIDRTNYWPGPETDSQGKITFPALVPGATYRLSTFRDGKPEVLKQFTVQSGQQIELGNITIDLDD